MTTNIVYFKQQARKLMSSVLLVKNQQESQLQQAHLLLHNLNLSNDAIRERLDHILGQDTLERYGSPYKENFWQRYNCHPVTIPTIRAGMDGSQISPDKDSIYDYAAINLAAVVFSPDDTAQEYIRTEPLIGEEYYIDNEPIDSDYVELLRDYRERQLLLDAVKDSSSYPTIALFDGPIELYKQPSKVPREKRIFDNYLDTLRQYCARNIIYAGYVDNPQSRVIARTLELLKAYEMNANPQEYHPYRSIHDQELFRSFLQPTQRSSIVRLKFPAVDQYPGDLELFGFYVNVSQSKDPIIARVEIPKLVAENDHLVNLLHSTIIHEAKTLQHHPYPWALIRAHEVAKLTASDRKDIEGSLTIEFRKIGIEPRPRRPKSFLKGQE